MFASSLCWRKFKFWIWPVSVPGVLLRTCYFEYPHSGAWLNPNRHWISVLYSILHPPSPKLGSIALLDLGNTPESTGGIWVLQGWIWQACDKLFFSTKAQPYEYIETFIPKFMPVCTMAYNFDYGRAREYIPCTQMYRRKEWPKCLTRSGLTTEGHLIVRDFAHLLQGCFHHSLILGSSFLGWVFNSHEPRPFDLNIRRQILLNPIPMVDIGSFCDAVERLCGLNILAHRFTTGGGSLDGTTLPHSWLVSILCSRPNLDKDTCRIPHFVNNTISLLQHIDYAVRIGSKIIAPIIAIIAQFLPFIAPFFEVQFLSLSMFFYHSKCIPFSQIQAFCNYCLEGLHLLVFKVHMLKYNYCFVHFNNCAQ